MELCLALQAPYPTKTNVISSVRNHRILTNIQTSKFGDPPRENKRANFLSSPQTPRDLIVIIPSSTPTYNLPRILTSQARLLLTHTRTLDRTSSRAIIRVHATVLVKEFHGVGLVGLRLVLGIPFGRRDLEDVIRLAVLQFFADGLLEEGVFLFVADFFYVGGVEDAGLEG